jgi:hypothetical protein
VAGEEQLTNVSERCGVAQGDAILRDENDKPSEYFVDGQIGAEVVHRTEQFLGDGIGVEVLLLHLRVREAESGVAGGASSVPRGGGFATPA